MSRTYDPQTGNDTYSDTTYENGLARNVTTVKDVDGNLISGSTMTQEEDGSTTVSSWQRNADGTITTNPEINISSSSGGSVSPSQPEPAQPEPAQPEPAQPEPAQPEPSESGSDDGDSSGGTDD
jgi:hypothetical protein